MAEYVVDEFQVKRAGLFAAWRGIRIYVSDGGVIRTENTTTETINLDRISDYKTNNRRYGVGNVITSFCNRDTFVKYVVTAIDERPFVLVTDTLDAPECGYETPLPQPHVPFTPFGTPTYNSFRTFDYCDYQDNECQILIEKKDYQGENVQLTLADKYPVKIKYTEVDNKNEPIRPMEFSLNFIEGINFELEQFFTEDERTFRVTIFKNGEIEAKGYVIPDSCLEDFSAINNAVSIKCTDSIQSLKTVSFPIPTGSTFDLSQSFIGVLCYCLAGTNLNLDINTICNYYAVGMPNGLDNDPLDMATINPLRLVNDKGTTLNCFEVLEQVCKAFGMFMVQSGGKWNFVRTNELAQEIIRQRTYDYTGLRKYAQNVVKKRIIGGYI